MNFEGPSLPFFVPLISCTSVVAAITTVVTIAEILKNNGLAIEKSKKSALIIPKKNLRKKLQR